MEIKNQKGFTLIELMITVTIVGVLAALAVPAYQDYAIRAQVAEGIALASGGKVVVSEYSFNHGEFPADNNAAGYDGAVGKYVTGVEITGTDDTEVTIEATFGGNDVNKKLSGLSISLLGVYDATGSILWSCVSEIEAKYLPNSCNYIEGNGSTNPDPGGDNDGGTTEPEIPTIPEPDPFDLQAAMELFPNRLDQGLMFGDSVESCMSNQQSCNMYSVTYMGKNFINPGELTLNSLNGGQQIILNPTSLDKDGNLVYTLDPNNQFDDFPISSVKINPDKTISFYKQDPNDPTKEILYNPVFQQHS